MSPSSVGREQISATARVIHPYIRRTPVVEMDGGDFGLAGVKLVIAEPRSNPSLVRQIEEKSGAKAVTLLPSGSDYLALFDENLRRLTAALKGS